MSRRRLNALTLLLTWLVLFGCSDGPSAPAPDASQAGAAGEGGSAGKGAGGPPSLPPLDAGSADSEPCNGRVEYCALHYGELVQPTANAATAYMNPPFHVLHQDLRVLDQLRQGVRALSLEVRAHEGAVVFCVGACSAGELPLYAVLDDVEQFLAESPRSVVSLLLDVHTSRQLLAQSLAEHRVAKRLHALGAPPFGTFAQLIDADERLVALAHFAAPDTTDPEAGGAAGTAGGPESSGATGAAGPGGAGGASGAAGAGATSEGGTAGTSTTDGAAGAATPLDPNIVDAAINDTSDLLFEVGELASTADLPCARTSGTAGAPLYRVSQVISAAADADSATLLANAQLSNNTDVIERRGRYCQLLWRHLPSFVSVDYFDTGGALQATQDLTLESLASTAP